MPNRPTRRQWLAATALAALTGCADSDSTSEAGSTAGDDGPPGGQGTESPTAGPVDAQFSFDFASSSTLLLVTHAGGDSIPAADLEFGGPGGPVTWAALSELDPSDPVEVGDITQLGPGNAYDHPVTRDDEVPIRYTGGDDRVRLALWTGER